MNSFSRPIFYEAEISVSNGAVIKTDWFKIQHSPFKEYMIQVMIHILEYDDLNIGQFFRTARSYELRDGHRDGYHAISLFLMSVIPAKCNVPRFTCDVLGKLYVRKKNIYVLFSPRSEGYDSIKLIFDPYYQWSVNGTIPIR